MLEITFPNKKLCEARRKKNQEGKRARRKKTTAPFSLLFPPSVLIPSFIFSSHLISSLPTLYLLFQPFSYLIKMRKLKEVSAYLTEIFYFKIMNKLSEDGVNIQEGKLVGYKSFVSANKCNTGQIVFLNQNIPRGVSYYLEQFGAELRYKFKGHNTHPHFTLLMKNEYSNFSEEIQKQIREEFKEQVVLVNVVGVVALSNPEEVILGLEVKMDEVNKWRKK